MSEESKKPRHCKRKSSKSQQFWSFMRRNRTFRVGDAMAILDISQPFCKGILWSLVSIGYARAENEAKQYRDRTYTLLKDSGAKSPSFYNEAIYDHNTKESFVVTRKHAKSADIKETISQLLRTKDGGHIGNDAWA
jgi:hypothetical protein